MSMLDWAKREIILAKEVEKKGLMEGEFDYGGACYDSALKAFESLTQDGHSGASIKITHQILNRLIDGKPLTPIEDTDDIWNETYYNEYECCKGYQCKRMSSLFKDVYDNGQIKYSDISSFYCVDINTNLIYHSNLAKKIIEDMFPIKMPYNPINDPMKVYCDDFLTDLRNGDYDTVGILYLIDANGNKVSINRYFKEGDDNIGWIEISAEEYIKRYRMSKLVTHPKGKED